MLNPISKCLSKNMWCRRSSDVVPPLLLNFNQDQSGNVRFCCIDDRSMNDLLSKVEQ